MKKLLPMLLLFVSFLFFALFSCNNVKQVSIHELLENGKCPISISERKTIQNRHKVFSFKITNLSNRPLEKLSALVIFFNSDKDIVDYQVLDKVTFNTLEDIAGGQSDEASFKSSNSEATKARLIINSVQVRQGNQIGHQFLEWKNKNYDELTQKYFCK